MTGFDPFALYDVGPVHAAGSELPHEQLAALGLQSPMATEPLSNYGVGIMEAMRRHKMPHASAGGPLVYGIGGRIDLTTITPKD